MLELRKRYEITKKKANLFMKTGNVNAYLDALVELSNYKKIMIATLNN